VVVDHFGKPDPARGLADPGFQTLLAAGREGAPLLVKLSAPYRCHGAEVGPYAEALLDALGPERLLWGSDWPWTQHEAGMTYDRAFDWLVDWLPDGEGQAGILARILDCPPALRW
jgi:predicted TIM-barrel fold metal-dependent hydrolase